MDKFKHYLRISKAAEYLGVCPNTLRNWERDGKIVAHRHPINDYRLFKKEDLDALLNQVQKPIAKKSNRPATKEARESDARGVEG